MSVKRIICFMILLSFVISCGGRTANPVSQYQYGDEKRSCGSLRMEMSQIQADIGRKVSEEENTTGKNVALGVTGVFFIVPWFFMDLSDADKIEMEALRNRYNALSRIAMDKGCGFGYQKIIIGNPNETQSKSGPVEKNNQQTKNENINKHVLAVMPLVGNVDTETRKSANKELLDGAIEASKNVNNFEIVTASGPKQIGSLYDWGKANNFQAVLFCKYTEEQNAGSYSEKVYRADITLLDIQGFSKKEYSRLITCDTMAGSPQPYLKNLTNNVIKEYLESKTLKRID